MKALALLLLLTGCGPAIQASAPIEPVKQDGPGGTTIVVRVCCAPAPKKEEPSLIDALLRVRPVLDRSPWSEDPDVTPVETKPVESRSDSKSGGCRKEWFGRYGRMHWRCRYD
jgi:hypothetical protein